MTLVVVVGLVVALVVSVLVRDVVGVEVAVVVREEVADVVWLDVTVVVGVVASHSLKVPSACDSTASLSTATVNAHDPASAINLSSRHVKVPAVPPGLVYCLIT